MELFEELTWRGIVNQVTHPELAQRLEQERFTLYCGFDPTADSLHVGSLLPILCLVRFQRAGHRPIALVGGATGLIGDPSGKAQERQLLSYEQTERNLAGIRAQLERFLDFDGPNGALVVNNADWLGKLSLIGFLRDFGKYFSVNVMLARESVRQRLEDREHGISYTEFSYSLLQAYDFLHLCRTYGCTLQIGGSDQWGNVVAGMDLTRRIEQKETFGLTVPLVEKADGTKFGKSEAGNVWLDPAKTSPYRFYQFWINQADADVPRWLRFFTFLSREEIAGLEREIADAPERRAAQRRLAEEVTRLVHGDQALRAAVSASQAVFGGDLSGLDDAALEEVFGEVPSTTRPRAELDAARLLIDVLVDSGIVPSKGEARRLVKSGGLYLNNQRIDDAEEKLAESSLCSKHIAVIRRGKKNYYLLKFL